MSRLLPIVVILLLAVAGGWAWMQNYASPSADSPADGAVAELPKTPAGDAVRAADQAASNADAAADQAQTAAA
ncbi:MAG: hypothetical protein L0G27_11540, partial [Paracoccus sp. (in: a-proteobacteria)]|nr:hypothetical protein [Paracoccus sp. (in: a-proteobacteria)]